jgi:hypothetical protein
MSASPPNATAFTLGCELTRRAITGLMQCGNRQFRSCVYGLLASTML